MAGPPDKPVTIPDEFIEAMEGVPELHVPPADRSTNVVVAPRQMPDAPVMLAGSGSTEIVFVAEHPTPGE